MRFKQSVRCFAAASVRESSETTRSKFLVGIVEEVVAEGLVLLFNRRALLQVERQRLRQLAM